MAERSEGIVVTQQEYAWLCDCFGSENARKFVDIKLTYTAPYLEALGKWLLDVSNTLAD